MQRSLATFVRDEGNILSYIGQEVPPTATFAFVDILQLSFETSPPAFSVPEGEYMRPFGSLEQDRPLQVLVVNGVSLLAAYPCDPRKKPFPSTYSVALAVACGNNGRASGGYLARPIASAVEPGAKPNWAGFRRKKKYDPIKSLRSIASNYAGILFLAYYAKLASKRCLLKRTGDEDALEPRLKALAYEADPIFESICDCEFDEPKAVEWTTRVAEETGPVDFFINKSTHSTSTVFWSD